MVRLLLCVGLLAATAGCDQRRCLDMTASEGGLLVTIDEHPSGWGEAECNACHLRGAIHQRACTPGIDMEAVRERVAEDEAAEECGSCHGDNGVLQ